MLQPKKNSYKQFDKEKKFLRLENSPPPPPITFLMVRPLCWEQLGTSHDVLKSFAIGSFLERFVVKIASDYLC